MLGMLFVRCRLNERDECASLLDNKETEDLPIYTLIRAVFILRHHFYCPTCGRPTDTCSIYIDDHYNTFRRCGTRAERY